MSYFFGAPTTGQSDLRFFSPFSYSVADSASFTFSHFVRRIVLLGRKARDVPPSSLTTLESNRPRGFPSFFPQSSDFFCPISPPHQFSSSSADGVDYRGPRSPGVYFQSVPSHGRHPTSLSFLRPASPDILPASIGCSLAFPVITFLEIPLTPFRFFSDLLSLVTTFV